MSRTAGRRWGGQEDPRRRSERGRVAEEAAAGLLLREGYQVIERNYRSPSGEIDLIAREGSILAFVEVRARSHRGTGREEAQRAAFESVAPYKRLRLVRAARHFLARHPGLRSAPCRFDAVAVALDPQGRVEALQLIRDAFGLP